MPPAKRNIFASIGIAFASFALIACYSAYSHKVAATKYPTVYASDQTGRATGRAEIHEAPKQNQAPPRVIAPGSKSIDGLLFRRAEGALPIQASANSVPPAKPKGPKNPATDNHGAATIELERTESPKPGAPPAQLSPAAPPREELQLEKP